MATGRAIMEGVQFAPEGNHCLDEMSGKIQKIPFISV
jgi:hypothetical protein